MAFPLHFLLTIPRCKYPAGTKFKQLIMGSQCLLTKDQLLSVAFKALHVLVPPGILAYEVTNPIHSSVPVSLPFLLNLERLVKLRHHLRCILNASHSEDFIYLSNNNHNFVNAAGI